MSVGQTPQSYRGYVGIANESTFATGVAPTTFVDAVSDGFGMDNNVDYQNTTRARGTYKGEAGPFTDEGGIDLPANPENGLGLLLLAAFGSETLTTSDPDGDNTDEVGSHAFTPANTLPSLSVEIDRDTDVVRHLGCAVDAFELSHTAEEMLTASVDFVASEPDYDVTAASPTYSDLRNFRFNDAAVTLNSSGRGPDVQEISFSIENNVDALIRNSRTAGKMDIGERPITATATLDFEQVDLFEQFLGGATATSPQAQLSTVDVFAEWTTPELIPSQSTDNYQLRWNMPTCTIDTHEATINQNDLVAEDVEFRALYDSGISAEAEVTLRNGITTAY